VGKSSVTTNLAVALAQRGHKVAAVDADVWGFSMPRMLGIDRPPTVIDDVILPPEANGVSLISMGFFAREDQPVVWRGPMLHKALEQFLTDVRWDEPDFLIVDMPPGTGDAQLSLVQATNVTCALIVTTPQEVAIGDALRGVKMFQRVNVPVLGIVENMSWFECPHCGKPSALFGSGGGQKLADEVGLPLLAQIPLAPRVMEGGDTGRPIVVADADSPAAHALGALAERVEGALGAPARR
jgi:ATP-binding protein involved in chromosome partitioning